MSDNVNHPSHYETGKFECIDVMVETLGAEATKNFCVCNAFKYIYRHRRKNGLEDIQKAIWYLNKAVELDGQIKKENGDSNMRKMKRMLAREAMKRAGHKHINKKLAVLWRRYI